MTDLERVRAALRAYSEEYGAEDELADLDVTVQEMLDLRAELAELKEAVRDQFKFNESSMEPRLRQLIEEKP